MKHLLYFLSLIIFFSCSNIDRKTKVGVQPFNNFPKYISDSISSAIKKVYNFETLLLSKIELPKTAYINVKSPRYRADSLLKFLKRNKPGSIDYIIGLTNKDMSTTKRDNNGAIKHPKYKYEDWGVFGLGFINGPSCVVSTYR